MAGGPGSGTKDMAGIATALIVAAGSGQRLGAPVPKALVPVAGRPMYEWSLLACERADSIGSIVVAVPPGGAADFVIPEATLVEGGDSRSKSVANGLATVKTEFVVVHDAARPLVTPELIDSAVEALVRAPGVDAVIAAAPVTDTIKRVGPDGVVTRTLDRSELRSVQTPQVFRAEVLRRAIASGDVASATDDASLIESAGGTVAVLTAPPTNIKITVSSDFELAGVLLGAAAGSKPPLDKD